MSPTPERYYAHSLPGQPKEKWEPLEDHLQAVAKLAKQFAEEFGAGDWGYLAGLWHDLGKYSEEFQGYLDRANSDSHASEIKGRIDHSTAGAQHAVKSGQVLGTLLAFCIAGHHAGLPNQIDESGGASGLSDRLKKSIPAYAAAPQKIISPTIPQLPALDFDREDESVGSFQISLFVRMLFSSLVDADFLATEKFMSPGKASFRPSNTPKFEVFIKQLDQYLQELRNKVAANSSAVNKARQEVLAKCRQAALHEPGLFSLQVPTGGGKTLSSLAFALDHAQKHGLSRVIYAIPFTSIIEQTANVFRCALGSLSEHVLEHHCNVDWIAAGETESQQTTPARLSAENWDAPIVVTTNVQLFESLIANRTSRCRKLHNIAKSVIVLDEAQVLPVDLLKPTLALLQELVRNYGCTVVLCTATQPSINRRPEFPIGLSDPTPIIEAPQELYNRLQRVEIKHIGKLSDEVLVERLAQHSQVLCIVNTRKHAAELFTMISQTEPNGKESTFHLSAQMCAQHRSEQLQRIKSRLAKKLPCRVISTQIVEAGVDIDLPVVYRAMAGLDSIAQAAGRCNREGLLEKGLVFIFETDRRPPTFIRLAAQDTRELLPEFEDLLSPSAIEAYFGLHYWKAGGESGHGWDKREVLRCFSAQGTYLQFKEAAGRYRLIEDNQQAIIIPFDEDAKSIIADFMQMNDPPGRAFDRKVQRYVVGLHERDFVKLRNNGVLLEHHDRYVLGNNEAYDPHLGLRLDVLGLDETNTIV